MSDSNKSTHIPETAGGEVSFTGSTTIETELRETQSYGAVLAQDSVAACASLSATLDSTKRKLTIKAWKADGVTAADVACKVVWFAFGK